jgi:hypothetical protein
MNLRLMMYETTTYRNGNKDHTHWVQEVAEDSFSIHYTQVSDTLSVMVTTVTVLCVRYTLRQKKELSIKHVFHGYQVCCV